mmetsp:Transcript_53153/g.159075  ORF Transcript_53153/g.159075 Transcript_53153/m.159075 type:complete len:240 (+) Transcript_53153:1150-1869(+)
MINSDSVKRTRTQLLSYPLLQRRLGCLPYPGLQQRAASPQRSILNAHEVNLCVPVIHIRVASVPLLHFGVVFVLIPKVGYQPKDLLRGADLFEPQFSIILHRPRLPQAHGHALLLRVVAGIALPAEIRAAVTDEAVVYGLPVTEGVGRRGGYHRVMDWEGCVDAVGTLAEAVEIGVISRPSIRGGSTLAAPENEEDQRQGDGGGGGEGRHHGWQVPSRARPHLSTRECASPAGREGGRR